MSGIEMSHDRKLTFAWLFLLVLTLGGGYLGETAEPGMAITLIVAAVIAIKGHMVIDHFMELGNANRRIRRLVTAYFYVLPAMVIAVDLFGPWLSRLTAI